MGMGNMEIDRRAFIASLGGMAVVDAMDSETKAEALEHYMVEKIDEAMGKNPKLSAEQVAEVKKLRAEGETLHKAGKHQESIDTLAKAMKILNIS